MSKIRPTSPDLSLLGSSPQVGAEASDNYNIVVNQTEAGFLIEYSAPEGHNPYNEKDWIGVYEGRSVPITENLGDYRAWNWVCPDRSCASMSTTAVEFAWQPNTPYTLAYLRWEWVVVASVTIITPAA
jgi:hypothetical protein